MFAVGAPCPTATSSTPTATLDCTNPIGFTPPPRSEIMGGQVALLTSRSRHTAAQVAEVSDPGAHPYRWFAKSPLFLRTGSGMNVLEACRKRRPGQRIVVLSNHATRDVRWRCAQLGADAVFDKSTELEALVDYCVRHRARVQEGAAAGNKAAGPVGGGGSGASSQARVPGGVRVSWRMGRLQWGGSVISGRTGRGRAATARRTASPPR